MEKSDCRYDCYVSILEEELICAMGCTEPIALAYAAAKAREVLGREPERCTVEASGNIIKNVKSVVVPHTGGMHGIGAAAAAGITVGDASAKLEVLSKVTEEDQALVGKYLESHKVKVVPAHNGKVFYLRIILEAGEDSSSVAIEDFHTNITEITKNGSVVPVVKKDPGCVEVIEEMSDRSVLNIADIVDFAETASLEDVAPVLERQIEYNSAISEEGLKNKWGASVGNAILNMYGDNIYAKACAAAAAGSDARMSGCELPVAIVSGSGNQGITASMPVITYAKHLGATHEELLRALLVSNLITIHQKTGIGRLSAFCGAVSAGCGAACGIAFLRGYRYDVISHTIINTLGMISGTVCDGAKASCAAKIAMAVQAGLLGLNMYIDGGNCLVGGDGILKDGVEATIDSVGRMASKGMRETDREILKIMTEEG